MTIMTPGQRSANTLVILVLYPDGSVAYPGGPTRLPERSKKTASTEWLSGFACGWQLSNATELCLSTKVCAEATLLEGPVHRMLMQIMRMIPSKYACAVLLLGDTGHIIPSPSKAILSALHEHRQRR